MDNSHKAIAYSLILFNLTEILGSGYSIWYFLNNFSSLYKTFFLITGALAGVVIINLFLISTFKCALYLKT